MIEGGSNRFLVPFLGEVKVLSMDNEQGIDNDEEVMGIPEGIEASEPLERLRQVLELTSSETRCS